LVTEYRFEGKLGKPHLLSAYRKDIARICTILREQELSVKEGALVG
jgi:ribosomal protein L29